MLDSKHWWQRLTPTVHHRIALGIMAVLAFTAGLVASPVARSAYHSLTVDRYAADPARAAPATNKQPGAGGNAVAPGYSVAELQRAMELYRVGERALYPRRERVVAPGYSAAELQRAMELYRAGERALYPRRQAVVPPGYSAAELQRAMELYRAGERALYPRRAR